MSQPAIHYAKISRINKEGFDITGYLSQLQVFTMDYEDIGSVNYNILSSQEHPTYYLYQIDPVYTTSSYYQVIDYTLKATKNSLPVDIGSTVVSNYTNVSSNPNSYFTSSLGTYYFYNTPNIYLSASFTSSVYINPGAFCGTNSKIFVRITRPDGLVLTKDMYDLSGFNSTTTITISGSTGLSFNTTSNTENPGIIENTSLRVWITNVDPGGGNGGTLEFSNFKFNISQSTAPQNPPDNIVVFSPDQVDFFYSDYNPLFGNAEINRISQFKMDVDYANNPLVPINFDQLISGSATRAEVQDSNYASQAWSNIRYNGCESTAIFSILNDGFNAPAAPAIPNTLDSGYGNLSPAEKNEAFFAYFEGVGGTGPEIIGQTAYLVKWIIDEKGNTTDPEINIDPFTGLQQNVGVINLTDTFEPGKNVNVSLISNDPLLTSNPNDDSLTGIHPITYLGRINSILITETGSNSIDYLRTASFSDVIGGVTPAVNYNFTALRASSIDIAANTPTIMNFSTVESDPSNAFSPHTTYYESPGTTTNDDVQVQFSTRIVLRNLTSDSNQISLTFEKSTDGGATWSGLPVSGRYRAPNSQGTINGVASNLIWYVPTYYNGNNEWSFTGMSIPAGSSGTIREIEMSSPFIDLNAGDRVRMYINSSHEYRFYGLDPDGTYSKFTAKMTYNPQLDVTSSYWGVGTYHPAYSRELTVLTASNQLTQIYNSPVIYYQNVYDGVDETTTPPTPTSTVLNFGFSTPSIPFNNVGGPLPGDYIRFEYNPNQVYNIKQVGTVSNPSSSYFGNLTLSVFPPIPSTANLNHFNIYRVVNDGSSVILDVPKPVSGYSFSGLLYPQFLSEALQASSSAIVQDLSAKGIIS
jgi:hypothetical protein